MNITNEISGGVKLYLRCEYGDKNLGVTLLDSGRSFVYGFYRNWNTPHVRCTMSGVGSDGREFFGVGDVYNRKRRSRCAYATYCGRAAMKDGVWNLDKDYKQDGMLFSWMKE